MAQTVTVKIGGQDVSIPAVANFAALERIWPALGAYNSATDGIAQVSAGIALLSAAVLDTRPELTVPEIKKRLRVRVDDGTDERPGIQAAVAEILDASGLVPKEPAPGEGEPAAAPADGTETSTI